MALFKRKKKEDESLAWNAGATAKPANEEPKENPCDKCYNKQHELCKGKGFTCVAFKAADAEE